MTIDLTGIGEFVVLVVADEILQGRQMDRNGPWIGSRLQEAGLDLEGIELVPDRPGALRQRLDRWISPDRLVVTTGGLGPTRDDRTREELAAFFKTPLIENPEAVEQVRSRHLVGGLDPKDAGTQVLVPQGAALVPNTVGTAPALWWRDKRCAVLCLPGPPSEVEAIWTESVAPALVPLSRIRATWSVWTVGLGESAQARILRQWDPLGVTFCSLPSSRGVEIRLECSGDDPVEVNARLDAARQGLLSLLGDAVVDPDGLNPTQALLRILRDRKDGLVFAESCTAGLAASRMAEEPGASAVLRGGVVAYADSIKSALLGVEPALLAAHGAVSEEVAGAMATGALRLLDGGQGLALAVTGITGPGGGTPTKPVGMVWIAAAHTDGRTATKQLHLSGSRDFVRERSVSKLISLGFHLVRTAAN